jgi:ATP-dependent HslUV protease ATP-binding subunit HslU
VGRRGGSLLSRRPTFLTKLGELFDPTVTTRTIINEGAVFGAFALWVLFSADQSFPLAAAFCYSVYSFQSKRVKREPEGPFFGGNAIVGAIFATACALAVACGVMTLLTPTMSALLGQSSRQVGAFLVIATIGVINIYVK